MSDKLIEDAGSWRELWVWPKLAVLAFVLVFVPAVGHAANDGIPRVAIVAANSAQAFADVLNASLSQESAFVLVERAELARLAAESSLSALGVTERSFALARLAHADAMLFISVDATDKLHPLLLLRLTKVSDASVLHGLVLPWLPDELETNVKFAAAQFMAPLKRIGESGGTTPLKVSLLGLRASVDNPKLRSFETTLNLLLAHRLADEPSVALMERWRLNDVVFEHSLMAEDSRMPAAGARLVDGSFLENEGRLQVRLRVKIAGSEAGADDNIQGSMEDPVSLVNDIVKRIVKQDRSKGEPPAWQPALEAHAYAEMGTWLLKHWLTSQAAEAFESAIALGDKDPMSFAGRVQAYTMSAYPNDLRVENGGGGGNYPADKIKPDHLPFHLEAAIRAAGFAADYMESNAHAAIPRISEHGLLNPVTLRRQVFYSAVRTLQAVHEAGKHVAHRELVNHLRMAIHRLVTCMNDPAEDINHDHEYTLKKVCFAAYWCRTPQETLAYYTKVFGPEFGGPTSEARHQWQSRLRTTMAGFGSGPLYGPYLEERALDHALVRNNQRGNFRLIDWDEAGSQNAARLWREFIATLRASPSPQAQADGLYLEISSSQQLETRLRLLHESVELLWKHRLLLPQEEGEVLFAALHPEFPHEKSEFLRSLKTYRLFLALCCDLFEKESWVPDEWLMSPRVFSGFFAKDVLSRDETKRLLTAMTGYRKRAEGDARLSKMVGWAGQPYAKVFEDAYTKLSEEWPGLVEKSVSAPPVAERLKVTRYWNLFRQMPMDQEFRTWRAQPKQISWHNTKYLNTDGTRVWLSHEKAGIISFDPRTYQTESFGKPPGETGDQIQQIVATNREVCAANVHALWRYDRTTRQWAKLDVPDAAYSIGTTDKGVLAAYGSLVVGEASKSSGAGIGWLTAGGVSWLVSTRRRPAEHALDTIDVAKIDGVFAGPGGAPWVSLGQFGQADKSHFFSCKVYDLNDTSSSKIPVNGMFEVFHCGDRTLLWQVLTMRNADGLNAQKWHAWCVRPSAAEPELLMLSDNIKLRLPAGLSPRWKTPAILEAPRPATYGIYVCPTLHGDELWILHKQDKEVRLIGLLPGREKPVQIPLGFVWSAEDRASTPAVFQQSETEGFVEFFMQKNGLVSTEHALALCSAIGHGVWILPWQDIRQWLAEHPQP
ncbi:hypothetical protein [Prosthecobacter sp.]|uniref:hypothetical protein n=1 Tax=Prosthecobacter sp. TaxID=1965333 RepID=UPI00378405E2